MDWAVLDLAIWDAVRVLLYTAAITLPLWLLWTGATDVWEVRE